MLVVCCAVLCARGARAAEPPPRLLEVQSQGYSRFEISEGDVVAFFTGGIDCTYLGYKLHADELRYNHASQVATASGAVVLDSLLVTLECETIRLDGLQGELLIDSVLTGTLPDNGVTFSAGSAKVLFPAGRETEDLSQVTLMLAGTGSSGVVLTGPQNSILTTSELVYRGGSGEVTCPHAFKLEADVVNTQQQKPIPADIQLTITGTAMAGSLSPAGMLEAATISDALLESDAYNLSAPELSLKVQQQDEASGQGYVILASGTPISGSVENKGQEVSFSAEQVRVESAGEDIDNIELSGRVRIESGGNVMQAEVVHVARSASGFAINAPQGLRVNFDLAALTGSEPRKLPDLGRFAQQE